MPRRLPSLELQFAADVDCSVELAEAGERIRANSELGSVGRRELPIARVEAIYEIAYLRMFLLWEDFLEQSFLRYICGFASGVGVANLLNPKFKTIGDAERAVLGARDFVSWANPNHVTKRSENYMVKGPHEVVIASNLARLEAFNSIRNRIAHSSSFARRQFDGAVISLVGHRYAASSAGRFLRDTAVSQPVPERWLSHIGRELKSLALQVCP